MGCGRLLPAEDDKALTSLLEMCLPEVGYTVIVRNRGDMALTAVRAYGEQNSGGWQ